MVLRLPDKMFAGAKTDLQPNIMNTVRKLFSGWVTRPVGKLA